MVILKDQIQCKLTITDKTDDQIQVLGRNATYDENISEDVNVHTWKIFSMTSGYPLYY